MKVLELFCGTKSMSNAFERHGHETYTVDWNPEFNPTLCADIGTLTVEQVLDMCEGHPDVIHASFDCTSYSVAGIGHHRKKNEVTGELEPVSDYAKLCDTINQHVLDLIKELNPKYWFIENPRGGLRKMKFMQGLPRYTVTYCQYNNPYIQELIFTMSDKKCPRCGEIKSISEFYKNVSRRDGFSTYCKTCIAQDSHDYYVKNKEKCRERTNKWRAANREYVNARDKRYRLEHPDIEFRKQQKYRETHREKLYLKGKTYRTTHADYFLNKARERKAIRNSQSDGTVTLQYEHQLFESQHGLCAYCKADLSITGKHLDHIIPLSRGGLHTANNVHWTCPTCNMSKGDSLESEWLKKERCKPTDIWTNHPDPGFYLCAVMVTLVTRLLHVVVGLVHKVWKMLRNVLVFQTCYVNILWIFVKMGILPK